MSFVTSVNAAVSPKHLLGYDRLTDFEASVWILDVGNFGFLDFFGNLVFGSLWNFWNGIAKIFINGMTLPMNTFLE